jgi:hypothetical protein
MHLHELEARGPEPLDIEGVAIPTTPVLWRGIASDWPCTKEWTLAGLAERLAGKKIRVRQTDNEVDVFFKRQADGVPPVPDQVVPVDEHIKSILGVSRGDRDRPVCAANVSIRHDPVSTEWATALWAECPISSWFPTVRLDEPRLWIGSAGQKSSIHNDPYDNLNAQIIGKKKFIVFAPEQHEYLYPEFIHPMLWASRIDPECPDTERFPKFASARGFAGELAPGDVLFIPRYWWHVFETTEASLNINRWIYSEQERDQCWHEQPSAKKIIDYDELARFAERKFASFSAQEQERHRKRFEELHGGMLRFAEERRAAAAAAVGPQS